MKHTQRPPGRPPLTDGEVTTPVTVRYSAAQLERADAKAKRDRVSRPELMRRAIAKLLDDDAD